MTDYKGYLTWMIDRGYYTQLNIESRIGEMHNAISAYTGNYDISADAYVFSSDLSDISSFVAKRIEMVNSECR